MGSMALTSCLVTYPYMRPILGISLPLQWVTCMDILRDDARLMTRILLKTQSFQNRCMNCEITNLGTFFQNWCANRVDTQNESCHKATPDLRVTYSRCCEISFWGNRISHSWHPRALPCRQVDGRGCRTSQTKLPENSQKNREEIGMWGLEARRQWEPQVQILDMYTIHSRSYYWFQIWYDGETDLQVLCKPK